MTILKRSRKTTAPRIPAKARTNRVVKAQKATMTNSAMLAAAAAVAVVVAAAELSRKDQRQRPATWSRLISLLGMLIPAISTRAFSKAMKTSHGVCRAWRRPPTSTRETLIPATSTRAMSIRATEVAGVAVDAGDEGRVAALVAVDAMTALIVAPSRAAQQRAVLSSGRPICLLSVVKAAARKAAPIVDRAAGDGGDAGLGRVKIGRQPGKERRLLQRVVSRRVI